MKIPTWLSSNAFAFTAFVVIVLFFTAVRLVWAHYVYDDITCAFTTCVRVKP